MRRAGPGSPAAPPSAAPLAGGFTLLEVMVALAILAGALLTVSEIVSASLRNEVRAQRLDVATLLARGKMVAVEEEYQRTGFKDFDDTTDGDFDEEGHAEVKWRLEVVRPDVDLSSQKLLQTLTGTSDLQSLVPGGDAKDGITTLDPRAGLLGPMLDAQLLQFGETLKKGFREVRLTVAWPDGKREESFTVVTHLVVLQPREIL
jgi:general secretion pathway protein I